MRTLILVIFMSIAAHAAPSEIYDVGYGTVEAPDEFVFKHTGTIDSFRGTLTRQTDGFTISFDIGFMAGVHMSAAKQEKCLFYRTHNINNSPAYTGIERAEGERKIITTIDDIARSDMRAPANFWADIKRDSDIAEFLIIVGTYKSKSK